MRVTRLGITSVVLGLQCVLVLGFLAWSIGSEAQIPLSLQVVAVPVVLTSQVALFVGILLGHVGLRDVKRGVRSGRRVALVGLWLGYGSAVLALGGGLYLFLRWAGSMSGFSG